MALETGTYISDLVDTNPTASDPKSQGDDQFRLIKDTVTNTLPNLSGPVTATHTELNYVDGVTSAIQTQIDAKAALVSPALTGTPTAPTAAAGTNNTQLATTAFATALAYSATLQQQMEYSGRTSNTILGVADQSKFINITSGTFTQTFETPAVLGVSWYAFVGNSGSGDITITSDGVTNWVMYPGEFRLFHSDGTTLRSRVLQPFARTFTATGTFTTPPGYAYFGGLLWGAGGSGGKSNDIAIVTGGGGGGACLPFTITAAAMGTSQTITIGAGGAVQASVGTGAAGGTSSIGTLALAYGGGGGGGAATDRGGGGGGSAMGAGGTTATTSGGIGGGPSISVDSLTNGVGLSGANGMGSTANTANSEWGGAGGGAGDSTRAPGNAIYGGGGGSGLSSTATTVAGGTSKFGGAGGTAVSADVGGSGTAPAGGGGATQTGANSGVGARGECRIWGVV